MPKFTQYGRKRFGRKPYGRGRLTRKSRRLTKRVKRVEKVTKRLRNAIETKHCDQWWDMPIVPTIANLCDTANYNTVNTGGDLNAVTPNAAQCFCVNVVGQGTGDGERIGREIYITSLDIGFIKYPQDGGSVGINNPYGEWSRTMLILVKEWNQKTTFSISDYITTSLATDAKIRTIGPYNWQNRKNFKVLYDKVHFTDFAEINRDGIGFKKPIKIHLKKRIKTIYGNSGSGVSSIVKNALFLVHFVQENANGCHTPFGFYRLKYQDP